MNRDLKRKNILVTGAGSGIGRACAHMFAKANARVVLLGRTADKLDAVMAEIGGGDSGHLRIVADTSNELEMLAVQKELNSQFAAIHGVVANAGINGVWAPLAEIKTDEWDKTLAVNLRGTFLTLKVMLPLLRAEGGAVVVVSSVNGTRIFSNSGATAYSCSKAAQVAFVKMTALELTRDGIRVNAVCPGAINTNIENSMERRHLDHLHLPVNFPEGDVPLTGGSPGSADAVASTVGFLIGDGARHVSGSVIHVDGAQSLLQG